MSWKKEFKKRERILLTLDEFSILEMGVLTWQLIPITTIISYTFPYSLRKITRLSFFLFLGKKNTVLFNSLASLMLCQWCTVYRLHHLKVTRNLQSNSIHFQKNFTFQMQTIPRTLQLITNRDRVANLNLRELVTIISKQYTRLLFQNKS